MLPHTTTTPFQKPCPVSIPELYPPYSGDWPGHPQPRAVSHIRHGQILKHTSVRCVHPVKRRSYHRVCTRNVSNTDVWNYKSGGPGRRDDRLYKHLALCHDGGYGTSSTIREGHDGGYGTSSTIGGGHDGGYGTSSTIGGGHDGGYGTSSTIGGGHDGGYGTSFTIEGGHDGGYGTSSTIGGGHDGGYGTSSTIRGRT